MSALDNFISLVPENQSDNVTLCQQCQNMLLSGKRRGKHHTTPESLEKAHAENCYLCECLGKRFREAVDTTSAGWPWTYAVERSHHYFGLCIKSRRHKTWLIVMHNATATVDTNIRHRKGAPTMEQSIQTAQKWIRKCEDAHGTSGKRTCVAQSQPRWYPTRLLALEGSSVRMILTSETPPSGHYAALSYCWGRAKFSRLFSSPEKDLSFEMPISEMETAFKQAIG